VLKKRLHLCNAITPESDGYSNILTHADLLAAYQEHPSCYLVNVHLNWDGRTLTSDYGFEVANTIRTKLRSKAPIIFYSPIKVDYFDRKSSKELKYKLLFGRGSAFIESPFTKAALEKVLEDTPPLTLGTLHDVATMLCDLKGMVLDKLNHNLKLGVDPRSHLDEVQPFLSELQKELVEFDMYSEKLVKAFTDGDTSKFREEKEAFLSLCSAKLTAKGQEAGPRPQKKHKILLLEDNKTELKAAVGYLKKNFDVIAESDAEKAINRIKADTSNEILAVISDWRLYRDESQTYWQKYQGYEVLEEASKTGRALFALTSQADFVVHQIRNELGFKFQLVKKQDFQTDSQKNLLVDWVQNACQNNLLNEANIPESDAWKKYKGLFLELRNSLDWDTFILLVFMQADEIWSYILKHGTDGNRINTHFGLSFSKTDFNSNLFPMLVMRLIWFGLWNKYGYHQERVRYELADEDTLSPDGFELIWEYIAGTEGKGQQTQDLSNVALTQDDIKFGRMFPHERSWLFNRGLLTIKATIELTNDVEVAEEDIEESDIRSEFTQELQNELNDLRGRLTELAKKPGLHTARKLGQITDDDLSRLRFLNELEISVNRSNPT